MQFIAKTAINLFQTFYSLALPQILNKHVSRAEQASSWIKWLLFYEIAKRKVNTEDEANEERDGDRLTESFVKYSIGASNKNSKTEFN